MGVGIDLKDSELYPCYTNLPNTIELVFSFDVNSITPTGGVRGCLDKVTIQNPYTGIYVMQLHDVFDTIPYPQGTPQPVQLSVNKPSFEQTMKISHIQTTLVNWQSNTVYNIAPSYYSYIWYWNPGEFPVEMANADVSIHNRVVLMVFDRTSNLRVAPVGLRCHMVITLQAIAENSLLIPTGVTAP